MAIADGLVFQIYPAAGETAIKNIVDGTLFSGTGTPTLVDEGSEKAWSIVTGTLLEGMIPDKNPNVNVDGGGVTIAVRFKATSNGSGADFLAMFGLKPSAEGVDQGLRIRRNGNGSFGGRFHNELTANVTGLSLNTIYTLVYTVELSAAGNDFGRLWINTTGRVGTDANASSITTTATVNKILNRAFINCQNSVAFTLLDFAYWDRQLTNTESSSVADNYRAVMPAPSGGTPPTGTVTIGTVTPNSTGASVPFTYDAADQTGFEYQLNETGTIYPVAASPATPTGLTPSTGYTIRVRAKNASGEGAWSTSAPFTTSAAGSPPAGTFTVGTITTTQTTASVPYTYSAADFDSIQYRIDGGAAVTASASPQSLTGLTAGTTYSIEFRAVNAFGNGAWSTSAPFTTAVATATFTTGVLRRRVGGGVVANTAMTYFRLYNPTTGALVLNRTDLSSDANGRVTCTDAALTAGVEYKADWLAATGETRMSKKAAT